ncbi:FMN-binding protein [Curtobacterium sp. ISL-83]|nr:FMN-binding protein [Curtobacterium sp. ISL-83]
MHQQQVGASTEAQAATGSTGTSGSGTSGSGTSGSGTSGSGTSGSGTSGSGTTGSGTTGSGTTGSGTTGSGTTGSGTTGSGTSGASGSSGSTTGLKDGSYTGSVSTTRYGDVQVKVTIAGGKITDVTALHLTDDDGRSVEISAQAAPILRQEALTAQSGSIDTVSGATYTSEGYVQSLQSALDQAR